MGYIAFILKHSVRMVTRSKNTGIFNLYFRETVGDVGFHSKKGLPFRLIPSMFVRLVMKILSFFEPPRANAPIDEDEGCESASSSCPCCKTHSFLELPFFTAKHVNAPLLSPTTTLLCVFSFRQHPYCVLRLNAIDLI